MAEEVKSVKSTTPKTTAKAATVKTGTAKEKRLEKELEKQKQENDGILEMLKMMQEKMDSMQKEIDEKNKTVYVQNPIPSNIVPSNVKVVSLLYNTLVLTTEYGGGGTPYIFRKFGESKTMRTDDLYKILSISAYRKQAEDGYFYICDSEIVEQQGLYDAYKKINDQKMIEKVTKMQDVDSVDIFESMNSEMKESIVSEISKRISKGLKYDRNVLAKLKEKSGFDVELMAEEMKIVLKEQ